MDIWCIGILFSVGLTNNHPFGTIKDTVYLQKVQANECSFPFISNSETTENLLEISKLVKDMLILDSTKRITAHTK